MQKLIIRIVLPLISLGIFLASPRGDAIFAYFQADQTIAPEIQPYLNEFVELGRSRGLEVDTSNLTIIMSEPSQEAATGLGERTVGQCFPFTFMLGNSTKQLVKVDPHYWADADDFGKEALLFHELGHCLLERYEHDDEFLTDKDGTKYQRSMMNSLALRSYEYQEHEAYYIDELFYNIDAKVRLKFYKYDFICTPFDHKLGTC